MNDVSNLKNKELLQIYDIIKEFLEYLDNEKEKVEVKKWYKKYKMK